MIKIQTSGDYVQLIYVDPVSESVQEEIKSDSNAIQYSSAPDGRVYLEFGKMTFQDIEPTEFEINGSAATDAADFITKLTALFSGGGGGTTIYTGDGSLEGDRTVDLNGHALRFNQNGGTNINATFDPTTDAENITFYALNSTDDTNVAASQIQATPTQAVFYTFANFQDGANVARIEGYADADESEIAYTADTHTFNGEYLTGSLNSSGSEYSAFGVTVNNDTGDGNSATITSEAHDLTASFNVNASFNDGEKQLSIAGTAGTGVSAINYSADTHTITGAIITPSLAPLDFVDDAAAAAGGVAVNQWYHTSGTLKIRLS